MTKYRTVAELSLYWSGVQGIYKNFSLSNYNFMLLINLRLCLQFRLTDYFQSSHHTAHCNYSQTFIEGQNSNSYDHYSTLTVLTLRVYNNTITCSLGRHM